MNQPLLYSVTDTKRERDVIKKDLKKPDGGMKTQRKKEREISRQRGELLPDKLNLSPFKTLSWLLLLWHANFNSSSPILLSSFCHRRQKHSRVKYSLPWEKTQS